MNKHFKKMEKEDLQEAAESDAKKPAFFQKNSKSFIQKEDKFAGLENKE